MALTAEAEYRNIDRYHGAFDGVPQMIRQLSEAGYILAVCTNGTNGYVRKIASALGLAPYFTWLQGAEPGCTKSDTLKMVLDKIRPDKAVMVGDRHHDMQAAGTTGCRLSAVNTAICPMRWTARTLSGLRPRISHGP